MTKRVLGLYSLLWDSTRWNQDCLDICWPAFSLPICVVVSVPRQIPKHYGCANRKRSALFEGSQAAITWNQRKRQYEEAQQEASAQVENTPAEEPPVDLPDGDAESMVDGLIDGLRRMPMNAAADADERWLRSHEC